MGGGFNKAAKGGVLPTARLDFSGAAFDRSGRRSNKWSNKWSNKDRALDRRGGRQPGVGGAPELVVKRAIKRCGQRVC